jgi:hypothetical protein
MFMFWYLNIVSVDSFSYILLLYVVLQTLSQQHETTPIPTIEPSVELPPEEPKPPKVETWQRASTAVRPTDLSQSTTSVPIDDKVCFF